MRTLPFALVLLAPSLAWATTYQVGAARTYTSPCKLAAAVALLPGDVVEVDAGTYTDACQLTASGTAAAPIVLRGVSGPRPVFDATGLDLSGAGAVPRAIFQLTNASYWLVEHLELTHAANGSNNGAGFRLTAGAHDVTFRDVSIHDNQDGAMSDGPSVLTIENSDIYANGANDGQSHNLYLQGEVVRLVGNHIHDSRGGQNVKLRTRYVEMIANLVENAGNYEIDLIQGPYTAEANANAVLVGNVIVRATDAANNSQTILWGTDNPGDTTPSRNGSLWALYNTFVLRNASNRLFHVLQSSTNAPPTHVYLYGNIVHATVAGTQLTADQATADLTSGAANFVTTGIGGVPAMLTGTVGGTDPGFVGGGDWSLAAGSPCIDAGPSGVGYVDGNGAMQPGAPTVEPTPPIGTTTRTQAGAALDLGAFEFGNGTLPMFDDLPLALDMAPGDGAAPAGKGCSCDVGGAATGAPWLALVLLALAIASSRFAR